MNKENCIHIGSFIKPHGINGALILKFENNFPGNFENTELIWVDIDGLLVPFFILDDGIIIRSEGIGGSAIVEIDEFDDEKQSRELLGCGVYIEQKNFEALSLDDAIDFSAIAGFEVVDKNYGSIGILTQVISYPSHNVLQIYKDNIEILIPFSPAIVTKIIVAIKQIHINAPEGLIELYLPIDN